MREVRPCGNCSTNDAWSYLSPQIYSNDGVEAVKCDEPLDTSEPVLEKISDWRVSNRLFSKLDPLGVIEDNLKWWPVQFEEV